MDEQTPSNNEESNTSTTEPKTVEDLASQQPRAQTQHQEGNQAWYKTKKGMALLVVAVVLLLSLPVVAVLLGRSSSSDTVTDATPSEQAQPELASVLALVEGGVETSDDGEVWQAAEGGSTVETGTYVRTLSDGRAVVLLDDGSAVRLDHNSEVLFAVINAESSEVTLLEGQLYSRVVESGSRSFVVATQREQFVAMGTAYKTSVDDDKDSLQVYESSVEVKSDGLEVDEGNEYDTESKETSSIDLEKLNEDEFVQWNKEQDSKDEKFKDDLGVLDIEPKDEEESDAPVEPEDPGAQITLGGSTADKGVRLEWSNSGVNAKDGYKIVYDKNDTTPSYKENQSQYVGADKSSHTVKIDDGKTYHFRICAYRAEQGTCVNYSNTVTLKAPLVEKEPVVSGDVSLNIEGNSISWEFGGTAPHGFKVTLSSEPNPTYPSNSIAYVGENTEYTLPEKPAGTYYVRVCKYTADSKVSGGCTDYSNQIEYVVGE